MPCLLEVSFHHLITCDVGIYIHSGGDDDKDIYDDILEYDPETWTWTQIATIECISLDFMF